MHIGLPPPPHPTVTSEFLKVNSGAGGFSNIAQPLTMSLVVASDIDTDTGSYVHVSCISHVLSADPRQLSSAISSFLYSSPQKRSFSSEFMSTVRQCRIHLAHAQLKHEKISWSPSFPDEGNSNSHVVGSILFSALP
jgi:hypothetical protein